jgi:hypothetical protein
MPEDRWTAKAADGSVAECFYYQSDAGCWATRKVGDLVDTHSPAPAGLSRPEVEALLETQKSSD